MNKRFTTPRPEEMSPEQRAVYDLFASGDLASLHIGTRRLVPVQSVEAFIEQRLAREATR